MQKLFSFVAKKQGSVGAAAFILIAMVLASRMLGLLRDRLLTSRFTTEELGVYFAAFRLPNFLFEILVMGALTTAFIPVFTKYIAEQDQNHAWHMTATLINVSIALLLVFFIPAFIWTDALSRFIAPGFSGDQLVLMSGFTRFMLVAQVVPLLIGNVFTGMLQSFRLFFIPALAPVIYNVGIILGVIFLSPMLGLWGPVVGVGIGAVLFMLIQVPLVIQMGYRHQLVFDIHDTGVREVMRLIGPRSFGLAVSQIDTTVDLILASMLGAKMVTVFNFAQHLQQLPIGLFGATIAQAALPALSHATAKSDTRGFCDMLIRAIHQVVFFVFPASVVFIVLRIPIVRLVFGGPRFDWEATVLTGMTLSMFSISLFAQALVQVVARGFYALYDSKTPVALGIIAIVINTVCSMVFVLVYKLPVWSLAVSTTIASIVHLGLLGIALSKKLSGLSLRRLLVPPIKMIIASVCMAVCVYVPLKLFDQLIFDTTRTSGLFLLTALSAGIGGSVYVFLCWVFGVEEVYSCFRFLQRAGKMGVGMLEPVHEVINSDTHPS